MQIQTLNNFECHKVFREKASGADVERDLIRTRTAEGRARAVQLGVKMGRPTKIADIQRQDIIRRRQNGEFLKDIAEDFGISVGTVSRITTGADSHKSRKNKKAS